MTKITIDIYSLQDVTIVIVIFIQKYMVFLYNQQPELKNQLLFFYLYTVVLQFKITCCYGIVDQELAQKSV